MQEDIFNNNVLHYFEKNDAFKMMESAIIDSIMRDVCSGIPRGSTGGFMEGSTCYLICYNYLTGN